MKLLEIKMKHVYLDFKVTLYVSSEKGKLYYLFLQREGDSNTDLKLLYESHAALLKQVS